MIEGVLSQIASSLHSDSEPWRDVAADQLFYLCERLFAFDKEVTPVTLFNRSVTTCPSLCKRGLTCGNRIRRVETSLAATKEIIVFIVFFRLHWCAVGCTAELLDGFEARRDNARCLGCLQSRGVRVD